MDAPPSIAREFAEDRVTARPVLKPQRCVPASSGEIVVCAANPEEFRLRPTNDKPVDDTPDGFSISEGVSLHGRVERAPLGSDGTISNRVMVDVRIKF